MKWITRFNPTVTNSEGLHVGHLYVAKVNETEARKSGGKFIIRIDDSQPYWIWKLGTHKVRETGERYVQQLCQFVSPDEVTWQSKLPNQEHTFHHELNNYVREWFLHPPLLDWIPDPETAMYPFAPKFTLEKVYWDFLDGITWLIRGEDLVSEACLYAFFVDAMNLPEVKQSYLPRLRADGRNELHVTTVSKTFRNYQIDKQIEKFGVSSVMDRLKMSCLKDAHLDFTVDNIKCNPTILGFVE